MTDEPTVISGEQVREVLMGQGVPARGIFALDGTYTMLTEADVSGKLAEAFSNVLLRENIEYKEDEFDCENFGAGLWFWTTLWHSKQKRRTKAGVAFGLMCNSDLGHGFGFSLHKSDADVIYAVGIEPQFGADGLTCRIINNVPWEQSFLCVC